MNTVKPQKGKTVMLWTAALGLAVLAGMVVSLRRPILEEWYLFRLRSGDEDTQKMAAGKLGEMESVRAIPRLLEILEGATEEREKTHYARLALLRIGLPAIPFLLEALKDGDRASTEYLGPLLSEFGPEAFPVFLRAMEDEDARVRALAFSRVCDHIDRLTSQEDDQVVQPLSSLLEPGPRAGEVVSTFFRMLENAQEDAALRHGAARALGSFGQLAVAILLNGVKSADPVVRAECITVLGISSSQGTEFLPYYVEALDDVAREVRASAILALARIGPAARESVPALIKVLEDRRQDVRFSVLMALLRIGASEGAVPNLIKILDDEGGLPENRKWAAVLLGRIGPGAREALRELMKLMEDETMELRLAAMDALGDIGAAAKPAVPALIGALDDLALRDTAASALGGIGPAAEEAVPALIPLLCQPFDSTRSVLRRALVRIDHAAVRGLIRALEDEDGMMRTAAAEALGAFGAGAEGAVHALMAVLDDDFPIVPLNAARSLGAIGPAAREAVPALIKSLSSTDPGDWYMRVSMVESLGRIGPAAAVAVPDLQRELANEDSDVRAEAALALRRIGGGAESTLHALEKALGDGSVLVRSFAAMALLELGNKDPRAREAFLEALRAQDFSHRQRAAEALEGFSSEPEAVITALSEVLADEFLEVRVAAARSLGKLGPRAKRAVPALRELLEDLGGDRALRDLLQELAEPEGVSAATPFSREGGDAHVVAEALRRILAD